MADKIEPQVAYHSVSSEMDSTDSPRPKIELGNHSQSSQKRGIIVTFIVQIFALLWLVPVGVLLWLNFSGYIIGATAWCPHGQCWVEMFNPVSSVPQQRLVKFNEKDHDVLGWLQLIAKALEVWFVFISAALVYLVTMWFAAKHEGLPIGYLTRPIEFADPVTLVDPLLYRTGPHPWGNKSRGDKILGFRVYFLIILSVALCVLCNLMGPATAVLVIPTLQWITTDKVGTRQFIDLNSALPPQQDETAWFWRWTEDCSAEQIANQSFSCTYYPFGATLDQWAANSMTSMVVTSQSGLSFSVNATGDQSGTNAWDAEVKDILFWAPSRQIVSNLSTDAAAVQLLSQGYTVDGIKDLNDAYEYNADPIDTYVEYNKSRELELTRNGPIAGAVVTMWYNFNDSSNLFTVNVDANRQIRCYKDYDLWYTPRFVGTSSGSYTKCMQVGSGWGDKNKVAFFDTYGKYDEEWVDNLSPGLDVTIYASEKVAYLPNGTIPSWMPNACLTNSTALNSTNCDWERFFTVDSDSPMVNRSVNVNTIEYLIAAENISANFVVDFAPVLAFTNYTYDPSPFTNPMKFVKNSDLPRWGKSVHIDPAWILAAWAVDADGSIYNNRTMTNLLTEEMLILYNNHTLSLDDASEALQQATLLPIYQTLSLIDHSTKWETDTKQAVDVDHPLLQRYARLNVWAYKMGSRTSYLGAAVGILGCVVVFAQVFLGFMDRRRYRSPTQLLVAALEHAPRGEFEGKGQDELAMASVRFHIQDDGNLSGNFSFYEPANGDIAGPNDKVVR